MAPLFGFMLYTDLLMGKALGLHWDAADLNVRRCERGASQKSCGQATFFPPPGRSTALGRAS